MRHLTSNIIMPQVAAFHVSRSQAVEITKVDARISILEHTATTEMDIHLKNPVNTRQEAELILPVPVGAVIRGITFEGEGKEPSAEVLSRAQARRLYESIVASIRDPALLEFIGYNLVRTSIFPVQPNGTQTIRLIYEHVLPVDGERVDYVLPRSESLDVKIPWNISVTIKSNHPISTIYSPSHEITLHPRKHKDGDKHIVHVTLPDHATREPGSFLLSYILSDSELSASLFAYPDIVSGGGYFLLLTGIPVNVSKSSDKPTIKREVTLVIDRSGSMRGDKLEQVRETALQILHGLAEGEAFNIILYNENVDCFSKRPVLKTKDTTIRADQYLRHITVSGGTNIYDALQEALAQEPNENMLPIVLFLTDGMPTVGRTSESAIRELAQKGNIHGRRIFTFGVGVDVNSPLLDAVARETRATSSYVLPGEDIEVKVGQVYRRLSGPVFANPDLAVVDEHGKPDSLRTQDLIPSRIPDLFDGDQLVLLGKYTGDKPLTFVFKGNHRGKTRTFQFTFSLKNATTRNSFVPRLWASRKIAILIDAIRMLGIDANSTSYDPRIARDPKLRELVDEIINLSTEFGILTEYTAFLAREGTDLTNQQQILETAVRNFETRAIQTRSGIAAVNQSLNNNFQLNQQVLNMSNSFFDENMNRVQITSVQQINDMAFYNHNGQWVDSRMIYKQATGTDTIKRIDFGSEEYFKLAEHMISQNRQGVLSLQGSIMLMVDNEPVIITQGK